MARARQTQPTGSFLPQLLFLAAWLLADLVVADTTETNTTETNPKGFFNQKEVPGSFFPDNTSVPENASAPTIKPTESVADRQQMVPRNQESPSPAEDPGFVKRTIDDSEKQPSSAAATGRQTTGSQKVGSAPQDIAERVQQVLQQMEQIQQLHTPPPPPSLPTDAEIAQQARDKQRAGLEDLKQSISKLKEKSEDGGAEPQRELQRPPEQSTSQPGNTTAPIASPIATTGPAGVVAEQHRKQRKLAQQQESGIALSLVVNALPIEHLVENLEKLQTVARSERVMIGQVILVDDRKAYAADFEAKRRSLEQGRAGFRGDNALPPFVSQLKSMKLDPAGAVSIKHILSRLGVTSSPVWIIRHRGEDHIFEGYSNPSALFGVAGEFYDAQREAIKRYSLTDSSIPLIKHESVSTPVKFPDVSRLGPMDQNGVIYELSTPDVYLTPSDAVIAEPGTMERIPGCNAAQSRQHDLDRFAGAFKEYDVLYYNGELTSDRRRAERYPHRSVAYTAGQKIAEMPPAEAAQQMIALSMDVRCLPTRLRLVRTGQATGYFEYREGDLAWRE